MLPAGGHVDDLLSLGQPGICANIYLFARQSYDHGWAYRPEEAADHWLRPERRLTRAGTRKTHAAAQDTTILIVTSDAALTLGFLTCQLRAHPVVAARHQQEQCRH
jgi:hypothetical protein